MKSFFDDMTYLAWSRSSRLNSCSPSSSAFQDSFFSRAQATNADAGDNKTILNGIILVNYNYGQSDLNIKTKLIH